MSRYNRHGDDDSEGATQAMQMLSVGDDDNDEDNAWGGWTSRHMQRDDGMITVLRALPLLLMSPMMNPKAIRYGGTSGRTVRALVMIATNIAITNLMIRGSTLTLGVKTKVVDERDTFGIPVKGGITLLFGGPALKL